MNSFLAAIHHIFCILRMDLRLEEASDSCFIISTDSDLADSEFCCTLHLLSSFVHRVRMKDGQHFQYRPATSISRLQLVVLLAFLRLH